MFPSAENNLHLGNFPNTPLFLPPRPGCKTQRFFVTERKSDVSMVQNSILGAPWRWLQEANVKLKSCLSCESERLEMASKTQKPKILRRTTCQQKSRENGRHKKKLFHHDGMIWFCSAIFFLERLLCSFNWSGLTGSGSLWIPKELMQPSHTSDITHRAFQLYPGNSSKGTGWNMHKTWKRHLISGKPLGQNNWEELQAHSSNQKT